MTNPLAQVFTLKSENDLLHLHDQILNIRLMVKGWGDQPPRHTSCIKMVNLILMDIKKNIEADHKLLGGRIL